MRYFVKRGTSEFGPYSLNLLRIYLSGGSISPDDECRRENEGTFRSAREILAEIQELPSVSPSELQNVADEPRNSDPVPGIPIVEVPEATESSKMPRSSKSRFRRSLGRAAWVAFGMVLLSYIAYVALAPKNVVLRSDMHFHPKPGYRWVDPRALLDRRVTWEPGQPDPKRTKVVASIFEGVWRPLPGYRFSTNDANSAAVWIAGQRISGFPHITSSNTPGKWILDPGYVLSKSASDLTPLAVWQPGWTDSRFPHVKAADQEGKWWLDPGYVFAAGSNDQNLRTVWKPGMAHRDAPNVYASNSEGSWNAAAGYIWVEPGVAGDFRVIPWKGNANLAVWSAIRQVDTTIAGWRCANDQERMAAIRGAKAEYGRLSSYDSDPDLRAHLADVTRQFGKIESAFQECLSIDEARDLGITTPNVVGAALCIFADDWSDCWNQSQGMREAANVGEWALNYSGCSQKGSSLAGELNTLGSERTIIGNRLKRRYGGSFDIYTQPAICRN